MKNKQILPMLLSIGMLPIIGLLFLFQSSDTWLYERHDNNSLKSIEQVSKEPYRNITVKTFVSSSMKKKTTYIPGILTNRQYKDNYYLGFNIQVAEIDSIEIVQLRYSIKDSIFITTDFHKDTLNYTEFFDEDGSTFNSDNGIMVNTYHEYLSYKFPFKWDDIENLHIELCITGIQNGKRTLFIFTNHYKKEHSIEYVPVFVNALMSV